MKRPDAGKMVETAGVAVTATTVTAASLWLGVRIFQGLKSPDTRRRDTEASE